MSEHAITSTDETVRGYPGTVSRCLCGWRSSWAVRDGSAEADASNHMMRRDPEYRRQRMQAIAEYNAELSAKGCTCEKFTTGYGFALDTACPVHNRDRREHKAAPSTRCHDCSCHIDPPCGQCVGCAHADITDGECENDCQDCEAHDE